MANNEPIGVDVSGFLVLRDAVLSLLNGYPGLDGQAVTLSGLDENYGLSMEPESGALIYDKNPDILGGIHNKCQFPFYVIKRGATTSEYLKRQTMDFLETLGAWVCQEPVIIGETEYRLTEYPVLTGGRRITGADRSNAYGLTPNENKTQDWVIQVTVNYTHDFTKP